MLTIKPGLEGTAELTVTAADCADAMGSGAVTVLATPRLIALMEEAACQAMRNDLPEGQQSVGISVSVDHIAATPIGMKVTAKAVMDRFVGGMMYFAVTADDEREPIARGRHERCFIHTEEYMMRANRKKA